MQLTQLIYDREVIWYRSHPDYLVLLKRDEAFDEMARELGDRPETLLRNIPRFGRGSIEHPCPTTTTQRRKPGNSHGASVTWKLESVTTLEGARAGTRRGQRRLQQQPQRRRDAGEFNVHPQASEQQIETAGGRFRRSGSRAAAGVAEGPHISRRGGSL
ncbi:hypothetical protein quinque_002257 [Culex quinquefasciatus]